MQGRASERAPVKERKGKEREASAGAVERPVHARAQIEERRNAHTHRLRE